MNSTIRVDLHCHSNHSDGTLSPEAVADRLAADRVVFGALVDHDSLDGLPAFRKRLARHGIGFIPGVEITAEYGGKAAHLLAYGFDAENEELCANLNAMQRSHAAAMESIAGTLGHGPPEGVSLLPGAESGRIGLADGIALVHRAGGKAFLAHPLFLEPNPDKLDALLPDLAALGLDGIEPLYPAFTAENQARLIEMARRHHLLASAGSDFHHSGAEIGIGMPTTLWKNFRDAMLSTTGGIAQPPEERHLPPSPRRISFILRIVLPTAAAMLLFGIELLGVILPAIEQSLLERKREMIREILRSAWGVLAEAEQEVQNGVMPLNQAQQLAMKRIEALRYGSDDKNYFWLQDMTPRILMHPYRPDLNGQDVSGFRDPRGTRIFLEFANLVRRQDEGFVDYVWQWNDDPVRQVPKESYIRGFEPWGWIIGTGMYTEDVKEEIARFERHLAWISAGIASLIVLLLLYVIRQSLLLERKRLEAEEGLRESTARYRALVEAATEGTLLLIEGHCRYANPTLLRRLGYTASEMELLELVDLLPRIPGNRRAWDALEAVRPGEERHKRVAGTLHGRDGLLFEGLLAFSHISVAGREGLVLHARHVVRTPADSLETDDTDHALLQAARHAPLGLFRAHAGRRGIVISANHAALSLLPAIGSGEIDQSTALANAFPDAASFDEFMRRLERDGLARQRLQRATPDGQGRTITLDVRLVRDADGVPLFIDGCVSDTTGDARHEAESDALIERLQTSLLYLHETVEPLCHPAVFCPSDMPIRQVAALMTAQDSESALVRAENGTLVGTVTDRLIRTRVMSEGVRLDEPVRRIMREAVTTIPRHAQVYEALLLMQEKGVEHLAVTDDSGAVTGQIHGRDILHLHSSEAAMLTGKIAHAATAEEAIRWCRRAPVLVKALLDSGAHTRQITRLTSAICDAAGSRFTALALLELGPPPCPFVFLALGSQGRQEMTFFADQDNALLYDPAQSDLAANKAAGDYFIRLGEKICAWLEQAGYPVCKGGIMAQNPRWCASLAEWERTTTEWIRKAEPKQLLEFNIFLDFRTVVGQQELARRLRRHIHDTLRATPAFLPFLSRDLMRFKPPPNRVLLWLSPPRKRARAALLDLKDAAMPLAGYARLYALKNGLDETHTLDRLEALVRRNLISESDLRETAVAYEILQRLRLLHQAECLQEQRPLDNTVDWRRLDPAQDTLLREAFTRITALQKKISYDFLGGT